MVALLIKRKGGNMDRCLVYLYGTCFGFFIGALLSQGGEAPKIAVIGSAVATILGLVLMFIIK